MSMEEESIYGNIENIKTKWMKGRNEKTILTLLIQILIQILKLILNWILNWISKLIQIIYLKLEPILINTLMFLKKFEKETKDESQYENREFISANQKYLKMLKNQDPEEFERFYWDILVCVKRNDIFQNTVYGKMLPFVALCISVMSMMFSVANFFPDNVGLKIALTVVSFIAGFVSIAMFIKNIWSAMKTREFSYYEIMLALLEDLRNGEEETLPEEQSSRYVVTLQSCDCQEEDRPANTYDVTVQQRK